MGVGEKNSFPNVSFIIYVLSSSLEVFWQASNLVFPAERDGATFRDKGTEVPSLQCIVPGQAQNLTIGWERPGQPVKIRDGIWDGRIEDRGYKILTVTKKAKTHQH